MTAGGGCWPCGRPDLRTGARDDRSEKCCRSPVRACSFRSGIHRPDVSEHLSAKVQYAAGLVGYVGRQLGLPLAAAAPFAMITDRFARAVHRFAESEDIPWVDFIKGQCTDDVISSSWPRSPSSRGWCSSVGCARRRIVTHREASPRRRVAYPGIVKTGMVKHFYFCLCGLDLCPFFLNHDLLGVGGAGSSRGVATQAARAGEWMAFQVRAMPRTINWTRVDISGATVPAVDNTIRGGYLHIGRSSTDGLVAFRRFTVR